MSSAETPSPGQSQPYLIPQHIVDAVKEGKCILFLGAMASACSPPGCQFQYKDGPPGGSELSRRLAEKCNYLADDKWNLARVSLFFEHQEQCSRQLLVRAIADEVAAGTLKPSPALHMLAALPFRIIVTTNYDHLFDNALRAWAKDPIIRIYDPQENKRPDDVPLLPKCDKPILLKLHGDIDNPESIVVTEEDYIRFIQKMTDDNVHPIHRKIRVNMMEWPMLFVGYSLKDYNLRLLFRTLRWTIDPANFPLSFSVDPEPDNLIVQVWQKSEKKIVNFIKKDLWDFVPALFQQCTGKAYGPSE